MDRYNLALLTFILAVIPLAYISGWLSLAAGLVAYGLLARLAVRDLDRKAFRARSIHRAAKLHRKP